MEKVYFDEAIKASIGIFDEDFESDEFRKRATKVLDLIKNGAKKAINDTSKLKVIDVDDQEWIENIWFPKAIEYGLKYFAFVVPKDVVGKLSMQLANDKQEKEASPITLNYFSDLQSAKEWIKQQN